MPAGTGMQIINRTEGWGTQGNHYLSMSAQEAACILSDDYWAIIERRAKKKKAGQRSLWSGGAHEGEKIVPTSSALL